VIKDVEVMETCTAPRCLTSALLTFNGWRCSVTWRVTCPNDVRLLSLFFSD